MIACSSAVEAWASVFSRIGPQPALVIAVTHLPSRDDVQNVSPIDDERIKSHLDRVVRGNVEETLNALLDAEANRLCNAQRYERAIPALATTSAACRPRLARYG